MSNNTNRVNNPMKVITGPDTRWSYANVWEPKSINGKHTYHRASCHQHTHCADDVDIGVKCDTKGRSKQAHAGYNDGRNGRGKRRPHGLFLLRASDSLGFIAGGRQDYFAETLELQHGSHW